MWLKFGVARSGELTGIDEVVRGKTQLTCLYCGWGGDKEVYEIDCIRVAARIPC